MEKCSSIDAVHSSLKEAWQSPPNWDTIDDRVVEDYVRISGGSRIEAREAFKEWAENFIADIGSLRFEVRDPFEKQRVPGRLTRRVTGTNNGALGTTPTAAPSK